MRFQPKRRRLMDNRKEQMEDFLSKEVGEPVKITFRCDGKITFSTENVSERLEKKITSLFKAREEASGNKITVLHDDESGSYVYVKP